MELAAAAWRHLQSFRYVGASPHRRVGPLQRHRRCRPRHAAVALRLHHFGDFLFHSGGSAGALSRVAPAAYPLVQRLDADLPRAYAESHTTLARTRTGWILGLSAGGRRHGPRGAGASVLFG